MRRNPVARDLRSPCGKYRKRVVASKRAYRRKDKHPQKGSNDRGA